MKIGRLLPRSKPTRNVFSRPIACERLESRLLLTASHALDAAFASFGAPVSAFEHPLVTTTFDLVATATTAPKFKGLLVTGTVITGTVSVTILNQGTGVSSKSSVEAFLRPELGGPDVLLTIKPGTVSSVAPKKTRSLNLNLTVPTTLAAGNYALVIKVIGGNAGADTTLVEHLNINAAAGFVSIGGTLTGTLGSTITAGSSKKGVFNLSITNAGNIPTSVSQLYNISLVLHPTAGGSDITLVALVNAHAPSIKPKSGKDSFNFPITLSAVQTNAIPSGSYSAEVVITPVTTPPSTPIVITGPTITFTGGTTTGGLIFKHGDTITFNADTQLTGSNFLELGSFVTNTNSTGSYRFSPGGLTLTYSTGDTDTVLTSFVTGQQFLDPTVDGIGRKVIFSFDATNGFLIFLGGTNRTVSYAKYG